MPANYSVLMSVYYKEHPDYSLVSGIVEEFSDTITNVSVRRIIPEHQDDIILQKNVILSTILALCIKKVLFRQWEAIRTSIS